VKCSKSQLDGGGDADYGYRGRAWIRGAVAEATI
jgi:hypothetical protein